MIPATPVIKVSLVPRDEQERKALRELQEKLDLKESRDRWERKV